MTPSPIIRIRLGFALAAPFFVLLFALLAFPGAVSAQTLYRCGKTFQDRPCDAGVEGKAIGKANTQAIAPASQDPVCAQQGSAAQKVRWDKEAGRSEADQIASASQRGLSGEFIHYVYAMTGSAAQVKARVETDCLAEKERERAARATAQAAQPSPKSQASSANQEPGTATQPAAVKPRPETDQSSPSEAASGCMDAFGPAQAGKGPRAGGVISDGRTSSNKEGDLKSRPTTDCGM